MQQHAGNFKLAEHSFSRAKQNNRLSIMCIDTGLAPFWALIWAHRTTMIGADRDCSLGRSLGGYHFLLNWGVINIRKYPGNSFCDPLSTRRIFYDTYPGVIGYFIFFRRRPKFTRSRVSKVATLLRPRRGVLTLTWYTYVSAFWGAFSLNFIAIGGFSSEMKEPKLPKVGVFWANYCNKHPIW